VVHRATPLPDSADASPSGDSGEVDYFGAFSRVRREGFGRTDLIAALGAGSNSTQAHTLQTALAALIAKTSVAQPREHLIKREMSRAQERLQLTANATPSELTLSEREPTPLIDGPDAFAAGFYERLKEKAKTTSKEKAPPKPRKPSKPRLIVDNDKPDPSDKK